MENFLHKYWWVLAIGGGGLLLYLYFHSKSTSSSTSTQDTSSLTPQYLIPMYGSGGNPDASVTGTTTGSSSGNQLSNSPSSQQQPFLAPEANWSTIPGLGSSAGAGQVSTTTNPGYDTFHIGATSNGLTVGALAMDVYPEATPTEALQQLEYYNPQLGSTPQVAQNTLSNNFITIPTQAGEGVLPSQQVKKAA